MINAYDDSEFLDMIDAIRSHMRKQGIVERYVPWDELAERSRQARWITAPTGTGLLRSLAEPLSVFFNATRMFCFSGPEPLALAARGVPLAGGTPLGEPLGAEIMHWELPAEANIPAIKLSLYRKENGQIILSCEVPGMEAQRVGVDISVGGAWSLRGGNLDTIAGGTPLTDGPCLLKLTFNHISPPPVREIPLNISVEPED